MAITDTRKFGGKTFYILSRRLLKKEAMVDAAKARNLGYFIRIAKVLSGKNSHWAVWTRSK